MIVKYFLLVANGFKTHKKLFWMNCLSYLVFVVVVTIIDYM